VSAADTTVRTPAAIPEAVADSGRRGSVQFRTYPVTAAQGRGRCGARGWPWCVLVCAGQAGCRRRQRASRSGCRHPMIQAGRQRTRLVDPSSSRHPATSDVHRFGSTCGHCDSSPAGRPTAEPSATVQVVDSGRTQLTLES
jgi:hypothetical protein